MMKSTLSVLLLLIGANAVEQKFPTPVPGPPTGTAAQNPDDIVYENGFECDTRVNWMNAGPEYSQISLTDGCKNNVCDANPRYGGPNDNARALQYCQHTCNKRNEAGQSCEGFFFQKHNNGHEICGFYAKINKGTKVWGGHQAGAICERAGYELVSRGDCDQETLVADEAECKKAIEDVFGIKDAVVHTWNTPAYAKGCFKHNYGNAGSA